MSAWRTGLRTHRLARDLRIPRPLDEVFPFFAEARNLERITPPWLHFRILNLEPIAMQQGTHIDYRLRLYGIPFTWQSLITEWTPPLRFVDEQVRGPYRLWRHEHRFEAVGGETIVRDEVTYAVPGPGIVHGLFVAPSLERIFAYRGAAIARAFRSDGQQGGAGGR